MCTAPRVALHKMCNVRMRLTTNNKREKLENVGNITGLSIAKLDALGSVESLIVQKAGMIGRNIQQSWGCYKVVLYDLHIRLVNICDIPGCPGKMYLC